VTYEFKSNTIATRFQQSFVRDIQLSLFLYTIVSQSSFKVEFLNNNSKANDLARIILNVINEKKPKSVEELMEILNRARILNLTEEEIIKSVMKLQAEGVIRLENQTFQSQSLANYLETGDAIWYWMTLALGAATATLIFTISENIYPWIYARNLLGVIFVLFLPGYTFIKAVFPINIHTKIAKGSLEAIERFAFSIGMSIALVSIVGLILYYSPWGLDLTSVVLSLLAFTCVFATAAVIKEFRSKKTDSEGLLAV
jgi:hypothetical protein